MADDALEKSPRAARPPRGAVGGAVGKVIEHLDRKERAGKPPPALAGRSATCAWYLKRADLLRTFPVERIEALSRETRLRQLARRDTLLFSDDDDQVHLVVEGAVKLCRIGLGGRRLVEGILVTGDVFGTLTRVPGRSYAVEAVDRTVLLGIPREDLTEMLRQEPETCLRVVQVIEERERRLSVRVESLVFKDVPTRVVETLLELSREYGEACPHGFAVDVRVSQQDIADLVGASRQMVNRVLRDLALKLYVKRKGPFLCILDRSRLERLAEGL